MAGCDNFVEQLWRKGKCANCFYPKESHQHDSSENIGEDTACISNYKGKHSVTQPQSQSVSHIKQDNVFSVERSENSLKKKLMQSENTKEKHELVIAPDSTRNEDHGFATNVGETDQNVKVFVTNKPKPTPRPRPRPFSCVGESTVCAKIREENVHDSPELLNGVNEAFENSLGKSHEGAVCNASSLESPEATGISIPVYNEILNNTANDGNIETVFETILREELEEGTSLVNMNLEDQNDKNICLTENDEREAAETDLSKLKVGDSEDDNDAYVPMRSSIALFVGEPTALQSSKTDVLNVVRHNMDEDGMSLNKSDRIEKVVVSCHFDTDKSATYVSESKHPSFKITDDMGSAQSSTLQEPVECGKLSPCTKEPVYENRPASISSDASSGQDSGYENIRKSTRSNSSNSISGNATDVDSNVKTPEVDSVNEISPVVFSGPESSIESSGTSCSSWGSSTWDSCSASDFHETSSDCHKAGTEFLHTRNHGDKPHINRLGISSDMEQSYLDVMDQHHEEHVYLNADAKPMTRPYKVVDISTGLLVPATENQTELPPLPPKEKDLRKDRQEEIVHEYLEPCEEVKGIPEQPPSTRGPPSVPDMCSVPGRSFSTAPNTILDKSSPVRRAPAPRPRSRVPSQFGTLPKPAPRLSKVLGDVPVKVELSEGTNQKMVTQPTVTSKALDDIPPPCPHSLSRLPSLKKSSQTAAPSSHPSPKMSTPESNCESSTANKPPENTRMSLAQDEDSTVGEALESPIKPKRSAPPPPPPLALASSPPPKSSGSQIVEPSSQASPMEIQPIQASAVPASNNSSASPKPSSPKSTIRRALKSMKKLGSMKKNKRSKTIEISGPIAVNNEVSGFLAQRARSESTPPAAQRISRLELTESEEDEPCSSPLLVPTSSGTGSTSVGSPTSEPTGERSSGLCSPIMPTKVGMGYQNFPLSKRSDTLERPKKPPRLAKVVKPLQHTPPTATHDLASQVEEEPTYLQPNEDEVTLKVEVALANLNDAELLAEALSRVEQEKLGPLPAIPRSRHVHFRGNVFGDSVAKVSFEKPQLPRRPMRVVSPTLINGEKSESKCRPPKLPSRSPNTKPGLQTMRERSHSLERRATGKQPAGVPRSRSLSSSSNILERRYNKILKLQMQTLEDMLNCWREELLPHEDLDLSDTRWSDYEMSEGLLDVQCPGAVLVPVKCAKFWKGNKKLLAKVYYPILCTSQVFQRSALKQDIRICETLPHHVNVSRVLTHFTDHVSGDTIGRPDCDSYETIVSISDQLPCETVADFLRRTTEEHDNDPEKYEKKVCLLLLQLLNALSHLQREAVVHRDLKVENLFLLDCGLLLVANFEHALQQDKNTQPSPFILSASVSSHFGGNLEHVPPEIFNAPEDAYTLNYEECDTFAAGCLVYELLHRPNPFAANPHLIEEKYHASDLPPLPLKSRFSGVLDSIARQLLLRHPQERMSVVEAIQMIQALLWGPEDLDDDHLEDVVGDWLETERAHTVATIARNQRSYSLDEFMETYLKCQFLVDGTEEVIGYNYNQLKN